MTKNYGPLKNLMDTMNAETMSEATLSELLPLWKNYAALLPALQQEAKGAEVILRWISNSVEFKLKKEALLGTKAKLSDVFEKRNTNSCKHE